MLVAIREVRNALEGGSIWKRRYVCKMVLHADYLCTKSCTVSKNECSVFDRHMLYSPKVSSIWKRRYVCKMVSLNCGFVFVFLIICY